MAATHNEVTRNPRIFLGLYVNLSNGGLLSQTISRTAIRKVKGAVLSGTSPADVPPGHTGGGSEPPP